MDFKELFNRFSEFIIFSKEDLFPILYSASESVLDLDRYHIFTFEFSEQLLEFVAEERKDFSDYFNELKIIRCIGSAKERKQCEVFERRFDSYILSMADSYRTQLSSQSKGCDCFVDFLFDRGQEEYDVYFLRDFEAGLCANFSISPDSMDMVYIGEFISIQIPEKYAQNFVFTPFYSSRIVALKNQKVQFMKQKEHIFFLTKWNVFKEEDITIGEEISLHGQNRIMSVALRGNNCIGIEYCGDSRDEGYLHYLESVLNNHFENIPAIKGLYYARKEYPLLIMEDCMLLEKGVTKFPVKEVNQVSFLLDVVNCIIKFRDTNQSIAIKVYSDAVYVHDKGKRLEAKLCPLYGYSFTLDPGEVIYHKPSKSLLLDDLQWMVNITKYLQFGNYTDKLPEDHVMKKLLEQKWLSTDDNFRPCSFRALREDLQDLHGKYMIIH